MRFILLAEGHTERCLPEFLKRWLDRRLSRSIGIHFVRFNGWPDFWRGVRRKALYHLSTPSAGDIVGVIGLLDLYGPTIYPDHLHSPNDKHYWAVKKIEAEVGNPKFRMFFAVHETEAWILSQPEILPREVRDGLGEKAICSPESVDFDEHPSQLLQKLYSSKTNRDYKKRVTGPRLFQKLDPEIAADKCPYLARMLNEMLNMARKAGL